MSFLSIKLLILTLLSDYPWMLLSAEKADITVQLLFISDSWQELAIAHIPTACALCVLCRLLAHLTSLHKHPDDGFVLATQNGIHGA